MAVNRERGSVRVVIENITSDLDGSLSDAIRYLEQLREQYPSAYVSYDDTSESYDPDSRYGLVVYHYVPETDEQMAARIAKEEVLTERRERSEREQLAALKAKYGDQ